MDRQRPIWLCHFCSLASVLQMERTEVRELCGFFSYREAFPSILFSGVLAAIKIPYQIDCPGYGVNDLGESHQVLDKMERKFSDQIFYGRQS